MAKVAIVLSGCGYLDGSEIHEVVLCMLHLEKNGHTYKCFAPDRAQKKVMDHLAKEALKEERNVLVESARIARSKIASLDTLSYESFDALLIPGGYGIALHLSDFAEKKERCTVDPTLKKIIIEFYKAKRPIGATCIAPVLLASVFKELFIKVKMTLGSSDEWNDLLENMGMIGEIASVDEFIADKTHKIYTTPCYMEPEDLAGVSEGIEAMIKEFL